MNRLWVWLASLAISTVGVAAGGSENGRALTAGLENPGYDDKPAWFKASFFATREHIAEASETGRRLMLYLYQDGCPLLRQAAE